MQMLLALLLGSVAAVAAVNLKCHHRHRERPTIDDLPKADWNGSTPQALVEMATCKADGTQVCAHWLRKLARGWLDSYDGCHDDDAGRAGLFKLRSRVVLHYCGGRVDATCFSALYMQLINNKTLVQEPAYLCCCHTDMCQTSDIYDFAAQQQANKTTPEPREGPMQDITCEVSMSVAKTLEDLGSAKPQISAQKTVKAVWAPCVDVVNRGADGMWRRQRIAFPYKYSGISYKLLVEHYCTASNTCITLDMVEAGSFNKYANTYRLTQAFGCCCSGTTNCTMPSPSAVDFAITKQQTPTQRTMTVAVTTAAAPTEWRCSAGGKLCAPRLCYRLYRDDKLKGDEKLKEFGCLDELTALPQQMVAAVCAGRADHYCFMTTDVDKRPVRLCCCFKRDCNRGRVIVED